MLKLKETHGSHDLLIFGNKGSLLNETNFWDSSLAKEGFCYLSWNAGVARLLVPDSELHTIGDMKTAAYAIFYRGRWPENHGVEGLEICFEDHTDSPFCLLLDPVHFSFPRLKQREHFELTIWTRRGLTLTIPARYRVVTEIPYLQAWNE